MWGCVGLCGVVWSYVGLVFCNVYEVFLYTFFCALFKKSEIYKVHCAVCVCKCVR